MYSDCQLLAALKGYNSWVEARRIWGQFGRKCVDWLKKQKAERRNQVSSERAPLHLEVAWKYEEETIRAHYDWRSDTLNLTRREEFQQSCNDRTPHTNVLRFEVGTAIIGGFHLLAKFIGRLQSVPNSLFFLWAVQIKYIQRRSNFCQEAVAIWKQKGSVYWHDVNESWWLPTRTQKSNSRIRPCWNQGKLLEWTAAEGRRSSS